MGDAQMLDPEPLTDHLMDVSDTPPPIVAPEVKTKQQVPDGEYTWRIPSFSRVKEVKLYSDKFEIGTYMWRLLVFPRGNNAPWVAVYLESPEAAYTNVRWAPNACFKLVAVHPTDSSRNVQKEVTHKFVSESADWGFTQFLSISDLGGFLGDSDTLELQVHVTIQRDAHQEYDSRTETGYVGLKNQGATCYMNSLLQYLYAVPYFRKAVYQMPTREDEEPSKCLPLALQSLFYKMQYYSSAPSTKDLTKSFGWGSYDAFMQHDIQELNRVLCEKLEEKMKGTAVEKTLSFLFEGEMVNYMRCVNVDYQTTRKETFQDISLDVKDCANVYESLNKFTEEETLDGDNQWKTDDFGLQDAKKGIKFEKLPPVLQLQLKRFDYDFHRDQMVKVNDLYEFPLHLDLDSEEYRFLADTADKKMSYKYKLHSVLVHSGSVSGGHYYAYIRPDGQQWLRFDDDKVYRETEENAVQQQFGGEEYAAGRPRAVGSNAYMLTYIRESDWDRIMCSASKDDLADHLRKRLEQEQHDKETRQQEKATAHQYCTVRFATDEDIKNQVGTSVFHDLVNFDALPPSRVLRLPKKAKLLDFKQQVSDALGVPPSQQRLWTWEHRPNSTIRPYKYLPEGETDHKMLVDLREYAEKNVSKKQASLLEFRFYLETPPAPGMDLTPLSEIENLSMTLLFIKLYEPLEQRLSFYSHIYAPAKQTVGWLLTMLDQEIGDDLPADCRPLELFEEVKMEPEVMVNSLAEPKSLSFTVSAENRNKLDTTVDLKNGDILVVQRSLESASGAGAKLASVRDFLSYIRSRRLVRFRRVEDSREEGFVLELQKDNTYTQVVEALAAKLGLEREQWTHLRLTQHNYFSNLPQRLPIRFQGLSPLDAILTSQHHLTSDLYYEILDMPLEELEKLKTLKVTYYTDKVEPAGQYTVRLPKSASVETLLHEVAALRAQAVAKASDAAAAVATANGTSLPSTPAASDGGAAPLPQQAAAASPARPALVPMAVDSPLESLPAAPVDEDLTTTTQAVLPPAGSRPLRLLEVNNSHIHAIIPPDEIIDNIKEHNWQLRVEEIPEDQIPSSLTPDHCLVHVLHLSYPDRQRLPPGPDGQPGAIIPMRPNITLGEPLFFGEPFLLTAHMSDKIKDVKQRIQAKLGAPPEEYAKWEWIGACVTHLRIALTDEDDLWCPPGSTRYGPYCLPPVPGQAPDPHHAFSQFNSHLYYIAIVHEDAKGMRNRGASHNRSSQPYDRPVRIYS